MAQQAAPQSGTSQPSQTSSSAQTPPGENPSVHKGGAHYRQSYRHNYRMMGGPVVARLTRELNLTPDQQTRAKDIFAKARQEAQALRPQLRAEREEMHTAIRSDNVAQIDRIALRDANVNARVMAIHAKAMARFYSTLTPDQKAKFDQMGARWRRNARMRRNQAAPAADGR